jgi:non-ribosomal peptide synthetase component E (peptide arylation enzyme)
MSFKNGTWVSDGENGRLEERGSLDTKGKYMNSEKNDDSFARDSNSSFWNTAEKMPARKSVGLKRWQGDGMCGHGLGGGVFRLLVA